MLKLWLEVFFNHLCSHVIFVLKNVSLGVTDTSTFYRAWKITKSIYIDKYVKKLIIQVT